MPVALQLEQQIVTRVQLHPNTSRALFELADQLAHHPVLLGLLHGSLVPIKVCHVGLSLSGCKLPAPSSGCKLVGKICNKTHSMYKLRPTI